MIKASLIDLDGFLVNSEELYLEANKIYLKQFNFEFTEELHRQGTGKKFAEWIKTVTSIDKPSEEILKERSVAFFDLVKKTAERQKYFVIELFRINEFLLQGQQLFFSVISDVFEYK